VTVKAPALILTRTKFFQLFIAAASRLFVQEAIVISISVYVVALMATSPPRTLARDSTTDSSFPSRKPVPTTHAPEPKSPDYHHWDPSPNGPLNARPPSLPQSQPVPPRLDPERHPYLYAPKKKFSQLSKRTKITIAAVITCILILIIGLAAGLSSRNKVQNLPLPSNNGGPYRGDLTYYAPGLGACGIMSKNGDNIVSVSHLLFDAVSKGSNPNQNPLCGKMIRARRSTGSVDLKVVDRCTGCEPRDLDITEKVFAKLANVDEGRVDVEWSWLEGVPGGAG
jgi:hypothetical protein